MLKKVIAGALVLCLLFCICAMTVGAANDQSFGAWQDMGERPARGQGERPAFGGEMPEGFTPPEIPTIGAEENRVEGANPQFGGEMPEGMRNFFGNAQNGQSAQPEQPKGFLGFVKTYSTPIISVVLLGLAYLFVIFYKRKHY